MATIELGNLYSTLCDASIEALRAVDSELAVLTPGCKFSRAYKSGAWDGMTRFFKITNKKFPTGLLSEVVRALRRVNEDYEIMDGRNLIDVHIPDSIDLLDGDNKTITLRDYQYEAVVKSLQATRGVINVATNGGKTEIACGIIKQILPALKQGQRIAFFTHAKEIFYQSHERLEKRLGIKVGLIGDGLWDEQDVTVVMIPTMGQYMSLPKTLPKNAKRTRLENQLNKIGKSDAAKSKEIRDQIQELESQEWDKLKENVKRTKAFMGSVQAFIADEVHHASSSTWYELFMKLENCYFRFGLTGTIDNSDPIGVKRLYGCTGRPTVKISNQYLIDRGFSARPTVYMIGVETEYINWGDYRDAYDAGIINNEDRNVAFLNIVAERAESGKQCLIIVNETSHGEVVEMMLSDINVPCVFVHGDRTTKFRKESLQGFKDGEIRVLISTTILDEGVDVSGINCLFLMAGGKSMRQILQRIGRALRKKEDGSGVEVYDALDYHNEYLAEHTMDRYNTYKAEGFEVKKI